MKSLSKSISVVLLPILLLLTWATLASSNLDSPSAGNDPVADITQFYAFVSPQCTESGVGACDFPPEELVLALTVNPSATEASQFSEAVVYHIYFENDVGVETQIDCTISAEQVITCAGLDGLSVSAPIGETGVNGDIRVFAGLRDDPRFVDDVALERFNSIGVLAFNAPGMDTVAGSNTLAIVIGIKYAAFPAGSGATDSNGHSINVQKTWVASERIDSGVNAGITGSWYNPALNGQGWVIEMISTGQFLFYFYGYEDSGDQLWLLGTAANTGSSTITADVLRFSGVGFGGNFDPSSQSSESVGSMVFDFSDCNNANVSFTSTDSGRDDFSTSAQRITSVASVDCVYLTEGQVDRRGRPMTGQLIAEEKRDAYNTASDPDTWSFLYQADLEAALTGIDSADGIMGNSFNTPSEIAPILADDRLKVDLEWSRCHGVWGLELSMLVPQPNTNDCGGYLLESDYIEEFLSMAISGFDPLYDDFVTANDVPFLTEFPFLAAPH
jgi:hypothetical protein